MNARRLSLSFVFYSADGQSLRSLFCALAPGRSGAEEIFAAVILFGRNYFALFFFPAIIPPPILKPTTSLNQNKRRKMKNQTQDSRTCSLLHFRSSFLAFTSLRKSIRLLHHLGNLFVLVCNGAIFGKLKLV